MLLQPTNTRSLAQTECASSARSHSCLQSDECSKCKRKFSSEYNRRTHEAHGCSGDRACPYLCTLCGATFCTKHARKCHRKNSAVMTSRRVNKFRVSVGVGLRSLDAYLARSIARLYECWAVMGLSGQPSGESVVKLKGRA